MTNKNIFLTGKEYQPFSDFWKQQVLLSDSEFRFTGNKIRQSATKEFKTKAVNLDEATLDFIKNITKGADLEVLIILLSAIEVLFHQYNHGVFSAIHTPLLKKKGEQETFSNTVVLLNKIGSEDTVKDLIIKTNKTVTQSYTYQNYPVKEVFESSKVLDTNVLVYYDAIHEQPEYPENHYDVIVKLNKTNKAQEFPTIEFLYDVNFYEDWFMDQMTNHLKNIFSELKTFSKKVKEINILSEEEKITLLERFNETTVSFPTENTLTALIEGHINQWPDREAVTFKDRTLTYSELNQKANWLAHYLKSEGQIDPNDIVAIMLDRSEWVIISILAILKSGGAYLPIDPSYPKERIQHMLSDSKCKTLISESDYIFELEGYEGQLFAIDIQFEALGTNDENLPLINTPDHMAYMIYTSGSTGLPKGVPVTHRALLNTQYWRKRFYGFDESFVTLQLASFSFDSSVNDIFSMLLWGGKLWILDNHDRLDLTKIKEILIQEPITNFNLVPSLYKTFILDLQPEAVSLRVITLAGERLPKELMLDHFERFPEVKIINEYGPTENAICSSACVIDSAAAIDTTIGKPISNTQIFILDESLNPLPTGVAGEICLSGAGLSTGYFGNQKLTAEKFVPHPFREGQVLYKTGDVGRWTAEGSVDFVGRKDDQVKIRGFRIELGEIEKALDQNDQVKQAIVMAEDFSGNGIELGAYIVATKEKIELTELKSELGKYLPEYMIPVHFAFLDQIPLTINGKLDKSALPDFDQSGLEGNYVKPTTKIEALLVTVWESVLIRNQIGIKDDFFSLGGDSIKAIQIASRLYKEGYKLEIKDIFENTVIEQLASIVKPLTRIPEQAPVTGKVLLTPIQKEIFSGNRLEPHHYNQSVFIGFESRLEKAQVETIFNKILTHHDALRMTFESRAEELLQVNQDLQCQVQIKEMDLSEDNQKFEEVCNGIQASINLSKGPLISLGLFQGENTSKLLIVIHHLVMDAVSWHILFEDIETLYYQMSHQEQLTLPLKTDSYQLWADRLTHHANSPKMLQESTYWQQVETDQVGKLKKDHTGVDNFIKDAENLTMILDKTYTERLLTQTHTAFGTEINDLLLASLSSGLATLIDADKVAITLEGHGRESILKDVDISRTVGWFTSTFPIILNLSKDHECLSHHIIEVKEYLRKIPNKGIGYGILKYLTDEGAGIDFRMNTEISFNYLGQFEKGESEGVFRTENAAIGHTVSPREQRGYLLEINGIIVDKQLVMTFGYNKNHFDSQTIKELRDRYHDSLVRIIDHCIEQDQVRLTPSDLTHNEISIEELNKLSKVYDFDDIYPLTPMQEGLLFHSLLEPDGGAYFEQTSYRISGKLKPDVVEESVNELLKRHEVLRTSYVYKELDKPLQVLLKERKIDFHFRDISHEAEDQDVLLQTIKTNDIKRSFNLNKDALIRVNLVKLSVDTYEFIWSHHHIIMDGWCTGILVTEYTQIYNAIQANAPFNLPKTRQYKDYIKWLSQRDLETSGYHWDAYLNGYRELATLSQGHYGEGYQASRTTLNISKAQTVALQNMSSDYRVTLSSIIQSLWGVLIGKYNATDDVVFGAVVSGRPAEIEGIEEMIGLFINTIPVRVMFLGETTFCELLVQMQETAIDNEPHHYFPLADIQNKTELKQGLLDHILIYENFPVEQQIEGVVAKSDRNKSKEHVISNVEVFEQTNYDLNVMICPGEEMRIVFNYNLNAYQKAFIQQVGNSFKTLLDQIITNPQQIIKDLYLIPTHALKSTYAKYNNTQKPFSSNLRIHEIFERQATKTPEGIALRCGEQIYNYQEINERSNRIAHLLRDCYAVNNGDLIGLMTDRSIELISGIIGILKSGAAYIPLDPNFPRERLNYIAENSDMKVILSQEAFMNIDLAGKEKISLDRIKNLEEITTENPSIQGSSEDLIYTIYTSGSTGKPKGVQICHQSVVNLLESVKDIVKFKSGNKFLAVTTFSFDISMLELFLPLLYGGELILADAETINDPEILKEYMEEQSPDIMQATPTLWSMLIESFWQGSETMKVLCGGEKLPKDLGVKLLANCGGLFNMYGPTETTIWSTCKVINSESDLHTIGQPLANTEVLILDKNHQVVPLGVSGELCIAGTGLAKGYYKRKALNEEKFITHPFDPTQKIYRTGDVAKWTAEGELVFLGRSDDQVKLRGHRIELGEIENVLEENPLINKAVVLQKQAGDQSFLCAYMIGIETLEVSNVRTYLEAYIPNYMIPAHFVQLENFPMTPNGKIDKKALPEPLEISLKNVYVAPENGIQEKLVAIWQRLLAIDQVSIKDNFFHIGGHSIKATQLVSRIAKEFNVSIELKDIFKYPILEKMANRIASSTIEGYQIIEPILEQAYYEVSAAQKRLWIVSNFEQERAAYNMSAAYLLVGKLNQQAFEKSFEELVARHEILRTIFITIADEPQQQIISPEVNKFAIDFVDLIREQNGEEVAQQMAAEECNLSMSLEKGPLYKATLIRLEEEKFMFLMTMHHIITDAWSMEVIMKEILILYNAFCDGKATPLPPLRIQYKDYAHWSNQQLTGASYQHHLKFWKEQFSNDLPQLNLPTDFPRPEVKTSNADNLYLELDTTLKADLEHISYENGATLFMTLFTGFNVLLSYYTKQTDLVVGSPYGGREHSDLENQIGMYLNTLALRTRFSKEDSFVALLEQTKSNLVKAYEYGLFPIDQLINELNVQRDLSRNPLFDVGFTWQSTSDVMDPTETQSLDFLSVESLDLGEKKVKTDLWMHVWNIGNSINISLLYNTDLFKKITVEQFLQDFKTLLEDIAKQPHNRLRYYFDKMEERKKAKTSIQAKTSKHKNLEKFLKTNKKKINLKEETLVEESYFDNSNAYPLVIKAKRKEVVLSQWYADNLTTIKNKLAQTGAILLRGFDVNSLEKFRGFSNTCGEEQMNYTDQSSPRSLIKDKVYTSTDHPADQVINMHNELSYSSKWPMKIMFFCDQPAASGGQTPICDSRRVLDYLSEATKEKFAKHGVMYLRNLVKGFGLSWQEVYQTDDPKQVENYCRENNIAFEWKHDDHLNIKWVRPAIINHPKTKDQVWFNHGYFFNARTLDSTLQEIITDEKELPFNTFYGNGDPIKSETIEEIRQAFEQTKISFDWQKGDILLLDNMSMAHGRSSFTGDRKVAVAMFDPYGVPNTAPETALIDY